MSPPAHAWLDHLSRISYARAHISAFALGSVMLLAIDLLSGSGRVWADTLIGAWTVLLVVHGLILIIARLLQELLADEDEGLRPSTEMRWGAPSTWTLPSWGQQAPRDPVPPTSHVSSSPSPAPPASGETPATTPQESEPTQDEPERVPWQAAVDTAWLAPRDEPTEKSAQEDTSQRDNGDDFTPLKLD